MRDPIEDLQHFRSEGTTVNPLPASEVRRRGDRMRRRNTALATVGGVAAVLAAVAVPVSVLQSGADDQGRDISPAPPAATWLQEVPAEFPLADGLRGGPVGDDGVRDLEQCAADTWHLERSVARADASTGDGVEGFRGRTLAVYADADAAAAALQRVRATVGDCGEDPAGSLRYVVTDEDAGSAEAEAVVVVEQAELEPGFLSDLTFTRLSRDGNAVLIDQAYTSAGGTDVVDQVSRQLLQDSALPRAALCVFDAQPCDLATVLSGSSAAQVVPDDFPLLDGVPADAGATTTGPARDLEPIALEECGTTVEVAEHTDLVRADWSVPGDERRRQLVIFADEQQAQAYVDAVSRMYQACSEVEEPDGSTRYVQALSEVGGYDAAAGAHISWARDGAGRSGVETVAVVREGAAVLVSTISSAEGVGPQGERIQDQTRTAFASVDGVVEAMQDL